MNKKRPGLAHLKKDLNLDIFLGKEKREKEMAKIIKLISIEIIFGHSDLYY